MGVLEGEDREQEIENLFEKMTEKFHNLVKEIVIQVNTVQRVPNKMNPKRSIPRHIVIKVPKVKGKERNFKAAGEKQLVTYNGAPIKLSAGFSIEILKARKKLKKFITTKPVSHKMLKGLLLRRREKKIKI